MATSEELLALVGAPTGQRTTHQNAAHPFALEPATDGR